MASIISPFQLTSTLSSRPGRTRRARASSNKPRSAANCSSSDGGVAAEDLGADGDRLREVQDIAAFEIAGRGHVVDMPKAAARSGPSTACTSCGVQT